MHVMDVSWITVSLPTAAVVVGKAVGIYAALVLLTRLAGLRSFSKMSSFDFAITVAFGSVLASAVLTREPPLAQSAVALATLFAIQYAVSSLRARYDGVTRTVDNAPLLVMAGSDILRDNLRAAQMTEGDLYAKLREANVTQLEQVRAVVMESTGDVSVLHADEGDPDLDADLLRGVRDADRLRNSGPPSGSG
jgi:uncharacterized membrane protein YcaP (DUF421 family)